MKTIGVYQGLDCIKTYESDIIPMVGDIYPPSTLNDDDYSRTVTARLLHTKDKLTNNIIIVVEYTHPSLVKK